MYAVEFEADITDRFIEIKDFEKVANMHARVILLVDDIGNNYKSTNNTNSTNSRFSSFLSKTIEIDNLQKFSRDELNAR